MSLGWVKSMVVKLCLLMTVLGFTGGLVLVSLWSQRLESNKVTINREVPAKTLLLGSQSYVIDARPGTFNFFRYRLRDRIWLWGASESESKIELLHNYTNQRLILAKTLLINGQLGEGVEALDRVVSYWLWGVREIERSSELGSENVEVWIGLADKIEEEFLWAMQMAGNDQVRLNDLMNQVLSEKNRLQTKMEQ